jgi:hypothetical protein
MTLRLNGSTSGYAEIDAPAVAGSNTLVLPGSNGSAYQFLRNGATAGTTEFAGSITSGTAVASTSGTSIDFTSIPSYVKRITVMFNGMSTNGSSFLLARVGTSSGFNTTGYDSTASCGGNSGQYHSNTTGFLLVYPTQAASSVFKGIITIATLGSNVWVQSGNVSDSVYQQVNSGSSGSITLSGTLDRIRITTVGGTNTFDAGSINILYEG